MANRLAASRSLYLQQHADNPVDWYPWGEAAFAAARATGRPVLLSVGYSACHWCHVMAHESFEDPAIAAQMNASFINVKVDREERPDVDALYMAAVQALSGHGGWPMTVFLTPDGAPFFGGTYFPPEPRRGMAGFAQVLAAVTAAWTERRDDVLRSAAELTAALRGAAAPAPAPGDVSAALVERAAEQVIGQADRRHGGFRGGPKFPSAGTWLFLLARHLRTGAADALVVVTEALDAMAQGGLYDHLGGGFHRYCVDERWTVPHFEKMLYDNAQLLRLYLAAWQVTGTPRYRHVVQETAEYLLREMVGPHGAFHATQDADAPGGEGAYFVWTPEDVRAALPAAEAAVALAWYDVRPEGNFDGATVLTARRSETAVATDLGLDVPTLLARRAAARSGLLAARARRSAPATDTKVIVAWNGLAIDALARAGVALDRPDWLAAAERAAVFVRAEVVWQGDPAHSWQDGPAPVAAFAEDVAAMAGAYVSLYEATGDSGWLASAQSLGECLLRDFEDVDGGFYRVGSRHEALLARQMDLLDASVPSGTALAVDALLRLAALTEVPAFDRAAAAALHRSRPYLAAAPGAAGGLLSALDDYLAGVRSVAIVGPAARADTRALLATVRARFLPGTVVAHGDTTAGAPAAVPLLAGRPPVAGRATAYVCRAGVCRAPVTEPSQLAAELTESPKP